MRSRWVPAGWSSRGTTCVSRLPTGSLCGDGTGTCYLLPVFDTVFVRRRHRRRGLALAMLRDFCQTFREDEALGVSWPISPAMYQGDGCVGEGRLGSGTRNSRVFQMILGRELPRRPWHHDRPVGFLFLLRNLIVASALRPQA